MRVNEKDIDSSIFSPKDVEEVVEKDGPKIVCYTILGLHDFLYKTYPCVNDAMDKLNNITDAEDRDITYAKKMWIGSRLRYYVKVGREGRLYNPIGMYDEGTHNKQRQGIRQWAFREVNQKVFNFYIDFLRTKNVAHLKNAEREMV